MFYYIITVWISIKLYQILKIFYNEFNFNNGS